MTTSQIASALIAYKDDFGANSQPSFERFLEIFESIKGDIIDIWCPTYDTIFIRFKKELSHNIIFALTELQADEIDPANQSDLGLIRNDIPIHRMQEVPHYHNKITKYIRFWWD